MKQHSQLFFLLFAFILLQYGCKKDGEPPSPYYNLEEVKAYSYFKLGSYWIYKDSITGLEDCVFVTSNRDKSGEDVSDYYETEMYSSYESCYYKNWMEESWATQYKNTPVWREKYMPGDYVGQTILFNYPFILYKKFYPYTQDGTVQMTGSTSNLILLNQSYVHVVKFNDSENITDNKSETNYYMAKHVGIIRREVLDSNQTWNLLRCNIVQ